MPRAVAVVVTLVLCMTLPFAGEAGDTLRVCADPDNLPFSSEGPGARGLYVDVAELVAARLGMRTEYTWWRTYFGMRSVRSTLLADRCDVFFGLPHGSGFMGRSLTLTRPFLDVGYALIAEDRSGATALKGRRVAVVFGTTPQLTLAAREGVRTVTFRLPEEALDALARGEVDAAVVWGPTAGYYNMTRLGGRYAVVPVAGEGLQWKVAAVKKGNETLKEGLERALAQLEPEIRRLADGPRAERVQPRAQPRSAPSEASLRRRDCAGLLRRGGGGPNDEGDAYVGRRPRRGHHMEDLGVPRDRSARALKAVRIAAV